jgi:hypothetical protein
VLCQLEQQTKTTCTVDFCCSAIVDTPFPSTSFRSSRTLNKSGNEIIVASAFDDHARRAFVRGSESPAVIPWFVMLD